MSDRGTGQWNKVLRFFGELVYIPPSIVYFGTWAALQYNPLALKIASKMAFLLISLAFPRALCEYRELCVGDLGPARVWWPRVPCPQMREAPGHCCHLPA